MGQLNYSIKNKQVAGIYIHIPFCKSACHYCNFHFSTSLHYKNELLAALLKEVRLQQSFRRHHLDLYADQSHFTHAFRKSIGYTPGQYRKAFDVRFLQDGNERND